MLDKNVAVSLPDDIAKDPTKIKLILVFGTYLSFESLNCMNTTHIDKLSLSEVGR